MIPKNKHIVRDMCIKQLSSADMLKCDKKEEEASPPIGLYLALNVCVGLQDYI